MSEENKINEGMKSSTKNVDKKRRSFAKAGAATPVLMMLGQRPAFGAFCTTSGFISATPGDVSSTLLQVDNCGGLSPGAYSTPYNGAGEWPYGLGLIIGWTPGGIDESITPEKKGKRGVAAVGVTPASLDYGTTMAQAFNYSGGYHADVSMYDVLHMNGHEDPVQIGAHLVAAALNAATGMYPSPGGLTVDEVRNMYIAIGSDGLGNYEVATGVLWTPAEIVDFIQQTFHNA